VRAECPNALISVDTFRASVAERALEAGADAINDISAGRWDPQLLPVVARERVPYFAMHAQGTPQTMQLNPQYADVVQEVYGFFVERLNALAQAGIYDVVLDPGFGFGKSVEHNYALLRHLAQFRALGRPLLVGISRKSMLTRALGIGWRESLPAATALHLHALQQGASLLRVHDVAPACQAIQLFNLLNGA
jgi:dihydropteroate synthase